MEIIDIPTDFGRLFRIFNRDYQLLSMMVLEGGGSFVRVAEEVDVGWGWSETVVGL